MLFFLLIAVVLGDQCPSEHYWDQNKVSCVKCTDTCSECWSATKCTKCKESYYLNSEYQCVQRTAENCKSYDGLYCIECNDGYYMQDMNCSNTCRVENCAKCNSNKCFKCSATYTLYEHKNGTQECIDCKLSSNDEKCGRCPLGKYFNTTNFECAPCRENCSRCTTADNCYLCQGDLALKDASNPTSPCVPIDNCEPGHYYGNHCEMCKEGYFVENGYCSECSSNCARCINKDQCVECKQGSTLSNGQCTKDENCIRSSDLMGCIECKEGWYLDNEGKCVQCLENCASCLNQTYCFRCSEGYFFQDVKNGKCIAMDNQTCSVSDQYGCLQCKYDVSVSKFDLEKSPKIKQELAEFEKIEKVGGNDGQNSGNTTERYYGFYMPYEMVNGKPVFQQECALCNPRCRICEYNSSWCTGCNEGYEMKVDGNATAIYQEHFNDQSTSIHTCIPKSAECEATEMGYCIKCIDTHFLNGIECMKCDESCESCTDREYCNTCKTKNGTGSNDSDALYWRPPYKTGLEGKDKGHCWDVKKNQTEDKVLLHCAGKIGISGCAQCQDYYYLDPQEGDCFYCGAVKSDNPNVESFPCRDCNKVSKSQQNDSNVDFVCTECELKTQFLRNGRCIDCKKNIEHCLECNKLGCKTCEDGYTVNSNGSECTRVNLELILPLVGVGLIFIIIIIVVIVVLIWRKRRKTMKEREKEIKPFKVSNEVEMALLSADNENFPLKTSTWTLDFEHAGSKVNIDTEYEQTIQIMNPTRKSYFFEILAGASHKYELKAEPMRFTLKPDYAIEVKFTIKMLCTAIVKDEIGIVAMDMDEEVKETAKLTILIESDLSTKLDHTELRLQMPAIGEGAFGMVFVGTYRGQKVAVKKMKARNLTEEQEKEFKHEVNMLTQYRHACVVNLVGAVYTEGEISIITEFADYGSLSKVWAKEKISYDLKIKFMEDAVVALSYLHENNILHRDVKGENVLVYSLNPHSPVCGKLTDFGTCRNISERSLQSKELSQGIGTPTYMAPECLGNNSYSYQADVYSFAIVLYETFTETQAYIEDERFNQPWMIPQFVIEGKRLERPEGMPDNYWALIEQCWQQEPEDRPLFPQIYATLASWGLDICHTEMSVKAAPIDLPAAPQEEEYYEENEGKNEPSSSSSSDE